MDRMDALYESCDKAIQAMNRELVKEFGKLKLAKYDELNVIRTVTALYRDSAKRAQKRYRKVAEDVYALILDIYGWGGGNAEKAARKAITEAWVVEILQRTDVVTLYRFDTEADRKAQRLIEALAVAQGMGLAVEIDRAMKLWSKQLGQYAINFTDYAALKAYEDHGVEMVEWVSQRDNRVCDECHAYDGQVFRIDELPPKHWGCRCRFIPVFRSGRD